MRNTADVTINSKSHMPFQLVTNSMTVSDFEPTLRVFFAIFSEFCQLRHRSGALFWALPTSCVNSIA